MAKRSREIMIAKVLEYPIWPTQCYREAAENTGKLNLVPRVFYLTIRPVARKGYGSIAHEAKPNGAIDPWPLRAKGLIVLVSPHPTSRTEKKITKLAMQVEEIFIWK